MAASTLAQLARQFLREALEDRFPLAEAATIDELAARTEAKWLAWYAEMTELPPEVFRC